ARATQLPEQLPADGLHRSRSRPWRLRSVDRRYRRLGRRGPDPKANPGTLGCGRRSGLCPGPAKAGPPADRRGREDLLDPIGAQLRNLRRAQERETWTRSTFFFRLKRSKRSRRAISGTWTRRTGRVGSRCSRTILPSWAMTAAPTRLATRRSSRVR